MRVERTIDIGRCQSPVFGILGESPDPLRFRIAPHSAPAAFSVCSQFYLNDSRWVIPDRLSRECRISCLHTPHVFHFVQLDVFTTRPLEGNQLAVFTDARGLSDDEMQKLARETNLCETTFILPRDKAVEQREGVKVRIFTVNEELPFAGAPYAGYGVVPSPDLLAGEIVLDLKVGKVRCALNIAMACCLAK